MGSFCSSRPRTKSMRRSSTPDFLTSLSPPMPTISEFINRNISDISELEQNECMEFPPKDALTKSDSFLPGNSQWGNYDSGTLVVEQNTPRPHEFFRFGYQEPTEGKYVGRENGRHSKEKKCLAISSLGALVVLIGVLVGWFVYDLLKKSKQADIVRSKTRNSLAIEDNSLSSHRTPTIDAGTALSETATEVSTTSETSTNTPVAPGSEKMIADTAKKRARFLDHSFGDTSNRSWLYVS